MKNDELKNKIANSDLGAVSNSASHEPDFRTQKGEWIVWNMLEYGNSLETACVLLRQKEIIDSI